MKILIVYASWFGHNRTIAKALAQELTSPGRTVICAPASRVSVNDMSGIDMLVLGTYTHAGRANRRLRNLCDAIPIRWLNRIAVATFGTQLSDTRQQGYPGGVEELVARLEARGCEMVVPPLAITLPANMASFGGRGIGEEERRRIKEFAADLLEATVVVPLA